MGDGELELLSNIAYTQEERYIHKGPIMERFRSIAQLFPYPTDCASVTNRTLTTVGVMLLVMPL